MTRTAKESRGADALAVKKEMGADERVEKIAKEFKPADLQNLLAKTFTQAQTTSFCKEYINNSRTGQRVSASSFKNTMLDLTNHLTMTKKGGSKDYRLFQAAKVFERIFMAMITGDSNAPPGCPSANDGFLVIEFDPNDPNHQAIVGPYDNFQQMLAAKLGFRDFREFLGRYSTSFGWHHNPATKPKRGQAPAGGPNRDHAMVLMHKQGCNFSADGPGLFGGREAAASYNRNRRKAKAALKEAALSDDEHSSEEEKSSDDECEFEYKSVERASSSTSRPIRKAAKSLDYSELNIDNDGNERKKKTRRHKLSFKKTTRGPVKTSESDSEDDEIVEDWRSSRGNKRRISDSL